MLPIRQSIFHIAEESGAQSRRRGLVGAAAIGGVREGLVVGLQIIVHDDQHHHRGGGGGGGHHQQQKHARAASIVLKQMVRPPPQQRAATAPSRLAASRSFLKACSLCRTELCPRKDVYMYRGDQGFCSEECRRQQILVDEAVERRGLAHHHHHHHHHRGPHHTPIRGRPRKTLLAVSLAACSN